MIASLLLLAALWVQIRRDLKSSYFRGIASALALPVPPVRAI